MTEHDKGHLTRRCPRLGGPITFAYCREPAGDPMPCWKILECWWEIFDVSAYLKRYLSRENFERLAVERPKPKVVSLVELIEQTKKNLEDA